jgi:hypothetical protein
MKTSIDDAWSKNNLINFAILLVMIVSLVFQWMQIHNLRNDVQGQRDKIAFLESKIIFVDKLLAQEGHFGSIVSEGSIRAKGGTGVGIGTTEPLESLDVRGKVRVSDVETGSSLGKKLCTDSNNTFCLCGKCAN